VVANVEEEIQSAIESGSFEVAIPLIEQYGQALLSALRGAGTSQEGSALASEAAAFLQDRLHLARVLRSHLAAQIGAASRSASYASAPCAANTWLIQG
jgi:hypothetical protein